MPAFLNDFQSILELFLNVLELFAIVTSVTTFFILMINQYSKALKKILSPLGLGFFPRMRILFICRKSQIKKRAFLEYAILETGGRPVINSEWHAIINSFKTFYLENEQGNLKYSISNCTPLIETEFSDAAARYFDYFSADKVKRTFGIQDKLSWVIGIRIEEAYATPTCLLTGLLSQYDENWEEFIKRYVSTAYITESGDVQSKNILSNELYFTFAWLLWGPSYELEYKKYWAGLCQLSYGDESNSIPAIANTETNIADQLKNKFIENEERRYGALISADVTLYEKKPFFAALRSNYNPSNAYFYDKVENGDLSFGVMIDNFSSCVNYKAKKYYSTAYVWVLFELIDDNDISFKPEKSVAFFEHANLANKGTYKFLIETLIDKSLKHFETIYKDPANLNRKYRFVCAMNDKIATECINKYSSVMSSGTELGNLLKERIFMETSRSPSEVFAMYDEYFSPSNQLKYVNVSLDDQKSISDFGQFYTDIYIDAFPDDDERETFDNFLKYMRRAKDATEYKYHIILAKDESDKILGGCVFNYYKKSNTGVIEFLAVRKDMQSSGIGTAIYKHVMSTLSEDAHRINGKALDYICCEIDSPDYSKSGIKKYLYFWNKNNYWHIDFEYVQPALSADQAPVRGLWFTISPQSNVVSEVPSRLVLDVIYDYIKYAMCIDDPTVTEEYRAMERALLANDTVKLKKIL